MAKRLWLSLRFRLVIISILIFGTALVLQSILVYQGLKLSQQRSFDASLNNYAIDVASAIDFTVVGDLVVRGTGFIDENKLFPFPLGQSIVQLKRIDGALILSSRKSARQRLPFDDARLSALTREGPVFESIRIDGASHRLLHTLLEKPGLPPLILQVAVPLELIENERLQILSYLWTSIPIALVLATLLGLIAATRALAPMRKIIRSARAIRPQELSQRVPVPRETELKDLSLTLNDLLARIERAFDSQERFIADASHQLKTPLAILRGEIDVFNKEPRSIEETRALLASASTEVDQLSKLVDDLLTLARMDSGAPAPAFVAVRLDELLLEAISSLNRLAAQKQIQIRFDIENAEAPEAMGDPDLLRSLFYNLIENAMKYSPRGEPVAVAVRGVNGHIDVSVKDRGPGIPEEDQDRVFDRFYRGSREQLTAPGVGLGLSIAKRIANLHGAELRVVSRVGEGAEFAVRIKKS